MQLFHNAWSGFEIVRVGVGEELVVSFLFLFCIFKKTQQKNPQVTSFYYSKDLKKWMYSQWHLNDINIDNLCK